MVDSTEVVGLGHRDSREEMSDMISDQKGRVVWVPSSDQEEEVVKEEE